MILITGASGNVGREVVKQALAVGLNIRATFRSADVAAKAPAGLEGVIIGLRQTADDPSSIARSREDFSGWAVRSGPASHGSELHQRGASGGAAAHC